MRLLLSKTLDYPCLDLYGQVRNLCDLPSATHQAFPNPRLSTFGVLGGDLEHYLVVDHVDWERVAPLLPSGLVKKGPGGLYGNRTGTLHRGVNPLGKVRNPPFVP